MATGIAKFLYKVYNKRTKQYVALGYDQKASWLKFPGAAIKNTYHDKKDLEVHKFQIIEQMVGALDIDGKVIFLAPEVFFL